jgi:thioredoxin-related protein
MKKTSLIKDKIIAVFMLLLISSAAFAQNWQTDFAKSKELAATENKTIILVFQGSDWCAPCIKLDTEIWSSKEFIKYSKEHFVMLKADFPRKSKNKLDKSQQEKNNQLAEKYNTKGYFPYVVVLDQNANVLGSTGYKKVSPSEYIEILNSF